MRIKRLVRSIIHTVREQRNRFRSHRAIFTEVYRKGYWGNKETVSGSGSTLVQTRVIRSSLLTLLREYKVTTLIDIPCGDFNWLKEMDLSGLKYIGCDIVNDIIEHNKKNFENSNVSFYIMNILVDPLPPGELILCRDCLVHFSNKDIFSTLKNIKRSKSTYLLMTTFEGWPHNVDIVTGSWRPIDFEKPPFNLPRPIRIYNEQTNEESGIYSSKSLGLWRIRDL